MTSAAPWWSETKPPWSEQQPEWAPTAQSLHQRIVGSLECRSKQGDGGVSDCNGPAATQFRQGTVDGNKAGVAVEGYAVCHAEALEVVP